ncbi:MAG: Dioxygenase [Nevskia sp.]|nr:Dioxygenase [Nevskia sp.]
MPVIVAPMFLVSGPELVIASCKAGLMGWFPTQNARKAVDAGADGLMGARFIACPESLVNQEYRDMKVRAGMDGVGR